MAALQIQASGEDDVSLNFDDAFLFEKKKTTMKIGYYVFLSVIKKKQKPSLNLASRLVFPMALAAQLICRRSSSSRRM